MRQCIPIQSPVARMNRRRLLAAAGMLAAVLVRGPRSAIAQSEGPEAAGLQVIDQQRFRLVVPFRTQKDGGPWQVSNCGPATLGMVLDGFGVTGQSTDDLRFRAHTYQGTVGMRTGTALDHIAHVAEDLGLRAVGLLGVDGGSRHWTVDDVDRELRAGHPVMPLVRLYLVPGYEGLAPRWGHYILVTGVAPGGFYFSDSLKTDPVAGTSGIISPQQLSRAIEGSHIPGQAVAFAGPVRLPVQVV